MLLIDKTAVLGIHPSQQNTPCICSFIVFGWKGYKDETLMDVSPIV